MKFIETVFEKLKRHPKRIVFPDGADPRVLQAAAQFSELKLGPPILLGNRDEIEALASAEGINMHRIAVIDPTTADDLPIFVEWLEKLGRYRKLASADPRELMVNPNYFGAMMIQHGQADGLVGGATSYAGTLMRPLIQLVKPLPSVQMISSCTMFETPNKAFGDDGFMVFADCAVIPDPTVDQLATIAVHTGKICRQLTGHKPRIAMLSFSTKGSSMLPAAQKVAAATALAKARASELGMELEIDGEMQADTALLPELAERKAPSSLVAGRANVFIFPDLNSANITSKFVQHVAGATAYGQILLGPSKPCADLSRGASAEEILGVAAIVGLQAIEYRKLYPEAN